MADEHADFGLAQHDPKAAELLPAALSVTAHPLSAAAVAGAPQSVSQSSNPTSPGGSIPPRLPPTPPNAAARNLRQHRGKKKTSDMEPGGEASTTQSYSTAFGDGSGTILVPLLLSMMAAILSEARFATPRSGSSFKWAYRSVVRD
jgi:hypothetical protein